MALCVECGQCGCNHVVPKDLQEEIGEGYDAATLDEAHAAADKYYGKSKKTIFVPITVEYHEPTDTIFSFHGGSKGASIRNKSGGMDRETTFTSDDVERAFCDNPARKIVLDEIKLYETEIDEWEKLTLVQQEDRLIRDGHDRSIRVNMDHIRSAIKALKLLANKF